MLRKHHKFRQGDKVRNFDVSLNLLLTPKQKSLESPYPYNISVMQQRFLLVKFGYLWFIIWQNSIYIRSKQKMEYKEYFMESADVRNLRTNFCRIRNQEWAQSRASEISDTKQWVRKYRTKHFPCGIVFIYIYILWFKFLFIVFNNKPRQNSVTRLEVKNSCKD